MLTKKITGNPGRPATDMPDAGVSLIPGGTPANQAQFVRQGSHARRMRRQERVARANAKRARGWSLGLW